MLRVLLKKEQPALSAHKSMQGRREGGWVDAVKWCFRGFNRLVGEIGVRGPLRRRESQGCDGALTNSGSLKLDAPPWIFRGAVSEWPSPSASPQRRSPPRVFNPDTTLTQPFSSISRQAEVVSVLSSLSMSRTVHVMAVSYTNSLVRCHAPRLHFAR